MTTATTATRDLDKVTDDMVALTKKALGMDEKLSLDWIRELQEWTNEVQDNLEDLLQPDEDAEEAAAKTNEPMLSKATFLLFLSLVAKRCSKKRPADGGPTEAERAEELKKDPAAYYTCMALVATIGWDAGIGHIEAMDIDDKIAAAEQRGTDKGTERAEELQELQEEATPIQNALEGLYREACSLMQEAILSGNRALARSVLSSGQFALDLGY